ncbi:Zc3h12a-like Ribonuclease NYN domain protein [Thermoplasmatales archaeon SCGC AB-539-N05]|nr:Zc3h12a-like Ribonuclease NYN domain protein [Thermoplasmatales archaeon SCGC AB-539-N05]
MISPFKNASKEEISDKLKELKKEKYSFNLPVLNGDMFWIYLNCRRFWGTYKDALKNVGVTLESDIVKNEFGFEIDHWKCVNSQSRKDWFSLALKCLDSKYVDISSHSLKKSPYFDIYSDAVVLFGKYTTALEYSHSSKNREGVKYPKSKKYFEKVFEMYLCDGQDRKREILKSFNVDFRNSMEFFDQETINCIVIVDGLNISYRNNKACLENVELVDQYLQEKGFRRENISIIVDANFPYKCNIDRDFFDNYMENDSRYCKVPAGQPADVFILTKADEIMKSNPNNPPIIISNDQYKEHFDNHSELEQLKSRKKGVTWTYIQKNPKPVINFWMD